MKFSPGKCYKDLLLEYLSMAIGDLAYLPPFEDYCNEYLVDYSIEELEKAEHRNELPDITSTEVVIAYKNRGIGSNSCGPKLADKYKIKENSFDFSFTIE